MARAVQPPLRPSAAAAAEGGAQPAQQAGVGGPRQQMFLRLLSSPRLALWLALIAVILSSSSLLLGFYLDDYVGRYIYSDLPGAKHLFELFAGGYGLANGNPADTHWQIEAGWAPYWTYDKLLIRLFRPFGIASHWLDMHLWPNSPALMHLHSLLWLGLLVLATTRMYRNVLGTTLGGLAALLFAVDHTHGFVVGYICNRHALITACLGVLCLADHAQAHAQSDRRLQLRAYALYTLALASGESTIAILGYLIAHALCVDGAPLGQRARRVAPYVVITLIYRVAYSRAGFGAYGSGLYIDPGREPIAYLGAFVLRAPVLLLGQFFVPPAELQAFVGSPWSLVIQLAAFAFCVALALALWPLLRRDRVARFWALGALGALVPAASTYPHNRQLLFTSFGAMALIAQLWQLHVIDLAGQRRAGLLRFSHELGAGLFFMRLVVSPLALPFSTCTVASVAPLAHAADSVGDEIAGRDVVFVTAPDYFAVKLVQLERRIDRRPLPRRFRALGFGPEHITVERPDARTLELTYAEGILSTPFTELYRDRRIPMAVGERIELEGLSIEVLELTPDGRARRVRFRFDTDLQAPSFCFYYWTHGGFAPFELPPIGGSQKLPSATIDWTLH